MDPQQASRLQVLMAIGIRPLAFYTVPYEEMRLKE
jgi:hypothetical protein